MSKLQNAGSKGTIGENVLDIEGLTIDGGFERLQAIALIDALCTRSDKRRKVPKQISTMEEVMEWVLGLSSLKRVRTARVMWIHGRGGTGKSTIVQAIAELCSATQVLLASYDFGYSHRDVHPQSLVATIAYQIATHFPLVRDRIVKAIDNDPILFDRSLESQVLALFVEPLQDLVQAKYFADPTSRRLIILDGLDEWKDRDYQTQLLRLIGETFSEHHLPLRFFIASRPEKHITSAFSSDYLKNSSISIRITNSSALNASLNLYRILSEPDISLTQHQGM